jgi:chemotaxis protein histidine kinase CheA
LLTILPRVIPPEIASRIDLSARIAEASAIGTKDLEEREKRAEIIIRVMEKSGVDAYTSARDIATSNPKMCLSLIAGLFNAHLGISIASESETREVVAEALEVTAEVEKAEEEACEAEEQAKGIEIEAQAAEVRATEEEAIVAKEVAEVEEAGTQQVANLETLLKELSEQIEFEKAAGAQALRQLILDLEAEETVLQQVTQEAENEEQEATRLNSEDRKRASAKLAGLLAELQEAEMNEEEELSKEQKSVEEECERTALELDEHRMLLQKQYLFVRQTMIQYVQQLKHVHRAETRTGMDGDDVFLSEEFGSRAAPSGENLAGESASNSGVAAHAQADSKYEISESNPNAFDDLDPSANQELALGLKQLIEQLVEANRSNIDRISKLTKKLERNERFLVLMDNKIGELSTEQEEYKRMSFSGKKKESTSGSRILSIFIK